MKSLRAKSKKPTHPGTILREDILPSLQISQSEFAEHLGVSRRTISEILHERRSITPDMAIRLGHYLDTTPTSWLNMQQAVDIWELENRYSKIYSGIKKYA